MYNSVLQFPSRILIASLLLMMCTYPSVFAQVSLPPTNDDNFVLSQNDDFSTNDRIFDREDTIYMKIEAPAIDFTGLAVNEFVLTPTDDIATDANEAIKGSFENQFDGTYVGKVDLSEVAASAIRWEWYALLEDDKGNQFKAEAEFFVGDPDADGIQIEIAGVMEEIGDSFFIFYGRKILVTENTEILSVNGEQLRLSDLAVGDIVSVLILISGEGEDVTLTALHIIKEETDRKEEVVVTGPITEIADRLFVVQNLVFAVTEDTKILGSNEEEIGFADLQVDETVTVIGQYQDDGTLAAILVIVEDLDRGEFAISGVIEVIENGAIIVQGTLFSLADNTIILSAEGDIVGVDFLQVGQFVEVLAQIGANGLPVAITIKVEENTTGLISAKGEIEQLFDGSLVVQGRKFIINDNTKIVDENGHPISSGGLNVGQEVTVLGYYISNSEMAALLIALEGSNSEEIKVEGPITELKDEGVVVQDQFFVVTDATVIYSNEVLPLEFGDLAPGQFVTIVGKRSDDGRLYATEIFIESKTIVVDGQIQRIDDGAFYVADFKFLITDKTEIIGEDGQPARFESLHVGALVIAEGQIVNVIPVGDPNDAGASTYVEATRVILLDDVREKITVAGPILELGDERFVVGDYVFAIGKEDTVVKDENGQEIDYGRLEPGMIVEVEAVVTAEGILIAVCIQVKLDRPIKISGKIEAIEGEVVVVGGVEFIVTDDTLIESIAGRTLALSDLQVGMLARVAIIETAAGRLVATHMKVLPRIEDEVTVTGVVEAVLDNSLVILGRTFYVTRNTVILDENDVEMDINSISPGRTVAVRADLLAGDGLVALKIKQLNEQIKDIQVTGPIEAIESNTVAVIGIFFFVDGSTNIFDIDGAAVNLQDLEVGETVELFATGQPDGTRLANLIREQDVVVASGNIASLSDSEISLLGASFSVDLEALVLDAENDHLMRADLEAGQYVEIRGISSNQAGKDGSPSVVTKIKILNQSVSVSIEESDESSVPQGFALHQNYPNPFNPVTTISFEMQQASSVSLTVYTLLGQEVTRLIEGNYNPGLHQVQWNGRDHAGQSVASGVYLYKLQVDAEIQTRRMILLK